MKDRTIKDYILIFLEYFGLLDANCDISEDSLGSMEASGITAL